jgi:O-antigen ligase
MSSLEARLPRWQDAATVLAGALGLLGAWALLGPYRQLAFLLVAGVAVLGGIVYLAWRADPAWTLTAGVMLAVFAGNWDAMGIPTLLAPDRIILFTGVIGVLARAPRSRLRAPFRIEPVHYILGLVVLYVIASAVVVGTLIDQTAFFVLFERFGVVPFLLFVCAESAFRTDQQRQVLLVGLVALGGYLGVTALLEVLNSPLIFPGYIDDPNVGTLPDRARGPFVEPATNGLALFTCAGACAVAFSRWPSRKARFATLAVGLLCTAGLMFTVTRQVWLAAVLATLATMLTLTHLRRLLLPTTAAVAIAVVVLLSVVPGLSQQVTERRAQQATIWDRINLNRAAINAIEAHPLVGVGWQSFTTRSDDYAELDPNFPLTAVGSVVVHNVFLVYGTELGLIGLSLWILALLLGIGGTLRRRGPPELVPWWALTLGVFIFFLAIGTFEFPQAFSNLALWLLAGVVRAGQIAASGESTTG